MIVEQNRADTEKCILSFNAQNKGKNFKNYRGGHKRGYYNNQNNGNNGGDQSKNYNNRGRGRGRGRYNNGNRRNDYNVRVTENCNSASQGGQTSNQNNGSTFTIQNN